MREGTYKNAFVVTAVMCVTLAGILAYVIRGRHGSETVAEESSVVVARGPAVSEVAPAASSAVSSTSLAPLTAVQLSPQRLQAIGLTTALVEMREVSNELRVPGNV